MSDQDYFGHKGVFHGNTDQNATAFQFDQMQGQLRTGGPVKVVAVHGGGADVPPTVDVQPLVNQIDGQGTPTKHGIVYGIPVTRTMSGDFALISDPVVGDVGHMVISDRDTSTVRQSGGQQSNPGSFRMHDMADGVFHGGMLGNAPARYIQAKPDGGLLFKDRAGNTIETFSDHIAVTPKQGNMLYVGGTGSDGSYDFIQTVSGQPSINAKVRTS